MRAFITGGGGFIGSHLTKYLLARQHQVTVYDNLSNYSSASVYSSGANLIKGDIRDTGHLKDAMKDHDVVIHLAAEIAVSDSRVTDQEMYKVNVHGTLNVTTSCIANNIPHLIAASSAAVYGEGAQNTSVSENATLRPISTYGKSKMEMEANIIQASAESNLSCTILRLFNVYGLGQSDVYAGVIKKFVKCAKTGKPLTVYGDGEQTRDFIHVSDVVRFVEKTMLLGAKDHSHHRNNKNINIYNIGSGLPVTINELARMIVSVLSDVKNPVHLHMSHTGARPGDVRFSHANISRAEHDLMYSPSLDLQRGIQETFLFTQKNHK